MVFLKQMLDKIGFREQIENANLYLCHFPIILIKKKFCLNLLLRVFGVAPIVFAHRNYPMQIKALGEIFDWRKTLLRTYINAIWQVYTTHQPASWASFFSWFFQNLNLNYFTLDIDSSVITRYGEQEGAKRLQS